LDGGVCRTRGVVSSPQISNPRAIPRLGGEMLGSAVVLLSWASFGLGQAHCGSLKKPAGHQRNQTAPYRVRPFSRLSWFFKVAVIRNWTDVKRVNFCSQPCWMRTDYHSSEFCIWRSCPTRPGCNLLFHTFFFCTQVLISKAMDYSFWMHKSFGDYAWYKFHVIFWKKDASFGVE
jgi:hypothetical protein